MMRSWKIQKAIIFNRGNPLEPGDILAPGEETGERSLGIPEIEEGQFDDAVRHWIRKKINEEHGHNLFDVLTDFFAGAVVREALNSTGGNRTQTAKLLGISRPTLIAKIEKYGLKLETTATKG